MGEYILSFFNYQFFWTFNPKLQFSKNLNLKKQEKGFDNGHTMGGWGISPFIRKSQFTHVTGDSNHRYKTSGAIEKPFIHRRYTLDDGLNDDRLTCFKHAGDEFGESNMVNMYTTIVIMFFSKCLSTWLTDICIRSYIFILAWRRCFCWRIWQSC